MDLKRKLLITLFTLSATTILAIMSLIFVLVDNPQGFNTNFDIVYTAPKPSNISFAISGVENISDFADISFMSSYTLNEPAIPKVHNKMLVGWYLDEELTNEAHFPLQVTEDITLVPYFKEGNVDSFLTYNANGYYEVGNVSGLASDVVIPDYYQYSNLGLIPVTTISYIEGSGNLYIGNKVETIPFQAVADTEFVNIFVGSGVTTIGSAAFAFNENLINITYAEGVLTSLGNLCFMGNLKLETVKLPSTITAIPNSAFNSCSSLKEITIPSGVISIGISAFNNCSSLSSITIPSGVTSMGDTAFQGCSSLISIIIPSGVTSIGQLAFSDCTTLTSLTFKSPTGWTKASDRTFTSSVTENISLTDPAKNATWFKSTSGYYDYYWKRV